MQILSVASECYPLIKTGGLADVVGALPIALEKHGVKITTLIPAYPSVVAKTGEGKLLHKFKGLLFSDASLYKVKYQGLDIILLKSTELFDRAGGPYIDENGKDWHDNWKRFAVLSKAAAELASGAVKGVKFDLVHCHDWQAALTPVYMKFGNEQAQSTPSIITIHNLAFQGRYEAELFKYLDLPQEAYAMDCLEYYNDISYLKGAIKKADIITTVSPTYAQEILTPEFGMGLEGALHTRTNDIHGILNGIDNEIWNPETDPNLSANFSFKSLSPRSKNRKALEQIFGLKHSKAPLFCVVSRLTWQKGIDVLVGAFDDIIKSGGRIIILGAGEAELENQILNAARHHKGKIGVKIGYDEELSHLMQGGSDAIIIPSRFEPCGLTQLYGLCYGCVPIVARTGGLADTIIDANEAALNNIVATGFQFNKVSHFDLVQAIRRAIECFSDKPAWNKLQKNAMLADFSWEKSAKKYFNLYQSLTL